MAFFPRFVTHDSDFAPAFRGENSLFRLMDDYASLVNRSFANSPSLTQSVRSFQPRFDMKENKDSYELHGELPGVAQKDINIEFTDANTLSIRGRTEIVREEGRRPTALLESQAGTHQKKLADTAEADTASTTSSNKSHQPTVEDEDSATVASTKSQASTSQEVSKNQQADAEKSSYWISERSVGSFARSFSFPQRVDQDAVKASLKDGILSIIVPKAQAPAKRRIQIE